MPDEIDRASEREMQFTEYALATSHKPVAPNASGFCHNCGESLGEGLRFCDADCAADWDYRHKIRKGARP